MALKYKSRRKISHFISVVYLMVVAVASLLVFKLFGDIAIDFMNSMGITSKFYQLGLVIIVSLALLYLLGYGLTKSIEKMLKLRPN